MYAGHAPWPTNDSESTRAGEGLGGTPSTGSPAAQRIASAASDAYPVLHWPSTRRNCTEALGATECSCGTTRHSAAMAAAILVPCHAGSAQLAERVSPGSVGSASRASPSLEMADEEIKS